MSKFRMYDEDRIERTLERKYSDRVRNADRRERRQSKNAQYVNLNHTSQMTSDWVLQTIDPER